MTRICLSLLLLSWLVGLPLSWAVMALGRRLGLVDHPGGEAHKRHATPVPNTGGVAIFLAVAAPVGAALALAWTVDEGSCRGWLAPLAEHVAGLKCQTPLAMALLAAMAIVHTLGLVDDRRRLSPTVKLAVEMAVGLVLAGCFEVRILQLLERLGPAGTAASVLLSALWIAAIINALNMLDNMDGLAGGVGAIIAGLYLAATLIGGQWFVAALCALLAGALLAFLAFNFPSARLFMGDGGSLVLGLLLAFISIRTTYYASAGDGAAGGGAWYGVLMPLVVLAVPLYDLASVCLLRLAAGRSPLVADQCHLSHRLVRRGLSRPAAVSLIWLATVATGLGGVMFGSLAPWQALLVVAQSMAVLAVLAILER